MSSHDDYAEALRLARLIVLGDVEAWCDQDSDKLAAHTLLRLEAERNKLREALRAIIAPDDLVEANEDAFSVYALRRCQEIARAALGENP